jgi:hypothetical protein
MQMNKEIKVYNDKQSSDDKEICTQLSTIFDNKLTAAESKIWHGHPVWFLEGNPIVGYCKLKNCIQLLFWSGQSFDEAELKIVGSFKAAEIRYTSVDQIVTNDLKRWIQKAEAIQWDYKNIVKRKGQLERLK